MNLFADFWKLLELEYTELPIHFQLYALDVGSDPTLNKTLALLSASAVLDCHVNHCLICKKRLLKTLVATIKHIEKTEKITFGVHVE